MKRSSQMQKFLTAISVCFFFVAYVWGGPGKTPKSDVSVDLVLANKSPLLGEDIEIEMLAENSGKEHIAVAFEEMSARTHLTIQDESGNTLKDTGFHFDSVYRGGKFVHIPPGGKASQKPDLTLYYNFDRAGKYRIRFYATVGESKQEKIYSEWKEFEIVAGKELFREDIKVTCRSVKEPPREEILSLVIYATPKFNIGYWDRVFEKDGKKVTERGSLGQMDPNYKPQVIMDSGGWVHMFVAKRPLTKTEIEERFKKFPNSYTEHMELRFYEWCKFCPGERGLWLHNQRPFSVRKEDNTELRLVKAENGAVMIHEFTTKGKDLGVYSHKARKNRKTVEGASTSGVATQPAKTEPTTQPSETK